MFESVVSCFCNSCGRNTDHAVLCEDTFTTYNPDGSGTRNQRQALRCGGCKECTLKEEKLHFSEYPDAEETATETEYRPARLWRRAPDWVKSIEDREPELKELLDEVYSATNSSQVRLLSMGVRTALDYVMVKIIGDVGTFEQKLDKMVEEGYLTQRQKENLNIVIDAGSASTHRGFKPPRDLLEEMVTAMEGIIRDHYITGPMLQTAKLLIPPRPPRVPRSR